MYCNNKSRWGRSQAMIGSSHPLDPPQEATGPIKRWSYMTMHNIYIQRIQNIVMRQYLSENIVNIVMKKYLSENSVMK